MKNAVETSGWIAFAYDGKLSANKSPQRVARGGLNCNAASCRERSGEKDCAARAVFAIVCRRSNRNHDFNARAFARTFCVIGTSREDWQ